MRSRWNLPVYLAYVVFCLFIASLVIAGIGVTAPWAHPYKVTAVFKSGDGILKDNEVFLNGVKVGRIDSVSARNGEAYVTMRIDDTRALPLHSDAGAIVRKKNLLGETFVELSRGSADGQLQSDSTIPDTRTASPVDIDTVLSILDPQTRNRLQLLISGAGDALSNNGVNLNTEATSSKDLFTSLQGPAAELDARKQQIDSVVLELEKFYTTLAAQRDQVRTEFGTWSDVMGQLANQEQAIAGTLQQADQLFQSTDSLLTGMVPTVRSTLDQLPGTINSTQAFLFQSNDILGSISANRKSIHDVFPFLQSAFADTDPNSPRDPITGDHQHFWSVFSISCHSSPCSGQGSSTSFALPASPNATWAAAMGGG
jgi:phospholipid/cholesterol/gamma-HCH transport system substrate-binding protein